MGRDNVWRQLARLEAGFPGFAFRLIEGRGKRRFEAVRKHGSNGDGLYAIISTDPAEVADELRRAALKTPLTGVTLRPGLGAGGRGSGTRPGAWAPVRPRTFFPLDQNAN
jgi:hypothetical protein